MKGLLKYISKDVLDKLMSLDLYDRSKNLVEIFFFDKADKNGSPYVNHLYRVSSRMSSIDGKILGLLHDVVEDIDGITFDDLIDFGVTEEIIDALKLVTNEKVDKEYTKEEKLDIYNKKIDKIIQSENRLAIELKLSDMRDNYDKDRLKLLPEDTQEWFNLKYKNNIKKLEGILKENRL